MKHIDGVKPFNQSARGKTWWTKRKRICALMFAVVLLIGVGAYVVFGHFNSTPAFIQKDKYQALFLSNQQVYFGKLHILSDGGYRLTDVYYLNTQSNTEASTAQDANDPTKQPANQTPTLVKLGQELHGPEDELMLKDDQVLFWENLKTDGKVAKAIEAYRQ